jgi:hypothetical protein
MRHFLACEYFAILPGGAFGEFPDIPFPEGDALLRTTIDCNFRDVRVIDTFDKIGLDTRTISAEAMQGVSYQCYEVAWQGDGAKSYGRCWERMSR